MRTLTKIVLGVAAAVALVRLYRSMRT